MNFLSEKEKAFNQQNIPSQKRGKKNPQKKVNRIINGYWFLILIFIGMFVTATILSMGIRFLYHMYQTLPNPEQLASIEPSLVSRVYAADNSLLHEFSVERRFWVEFDKIPKELQQAVVAIEDRRFYDHWGIDLKRMVGTVIKNIVSRRYAQGASTLTQQLARNVYLTSKKNMVRKVREILTSIQLESYYTKDEIMTLYLNMVYLGAGVYGIETASQRYFSKSVHELTLNECATLAGCIQLPEKYRPDRPENIQRTMARRNTVLRAMQKTGFISSGIAKATMQEPVPAKPQEVEKENAQYFVEWVRQYMEKQYGENVLYNGGLSIYTSIDQVAQDSTDGAISLYLDSLQRTTNQMFLDSSKVHKLLKISKEEYLTNFDSLYAAHKQEYKELPDSVKLRIVQASVIAINIKTGAIAVLTGGRNFNESKFNRAMQALRQPGSAFKPFVYSVAIKNGYTPASVVSDQPITLETPEGPWRPENYEHVFLGPVTIREALKKSINLVAIQVFMDVGADKVIAFARSTGLAHTLNPVPSLAIGSCEATNYEMTSAYSIFPNNGYQSTPYYIEKVVDKNGRVLEQHTPEGKYVLDPRTAYIITSLMTSVIHGGTASSVISRGFKRPAGGKTGTTNDYSDAWFIGYTPQYVCGVWTGVDERRSMGRGVTGSKAAIPIWVKTMQALHRNLPVRGFAMPDSIIVEKVCKKSNKCATSYCPEYYEEVFVSNNIPEPCDEHGFGNNKGNENAMQRFGSEKKADDKNKKGKRKLIF